MSNDEYTPHCVFCYSKCVPAALHFDEEPFTGRLYLSSADSEQHASAFCTEACEEGYRCDLGHWIPAEAGPFELRELAATEPPPWLGLRPFDFGTLRLVVQP